VCTTFIGSFQSESTSLLLIGHEASAQLWGAEWLKCVAAAPWRSVGLFRLIEDPGDTIAR